LRRRRAYKIIDNIALDAHQIHQAIPIVQIAARVGFGEGNALLLDPGIVAKVEDMLGARAVMSPCFPWPANL
jgi:hypothetical protein